MTSHPPFRKVFDGVATREQMFRLFNHHQDNPAFDPLSGTPYACEWFEISPSDYHFMLGLPRCKASAKAIRHVHIEHSTRPAAGFGRGCAREVEAGRREVVSGFGRGDRHHDSNDCHATFMNGNRNNVPSPQQAHRRHRAGSQIHRPWIEMGQSLRHRPRRRSSDRGREARALARRSA